MSSLQDLQIQAIIYYEHVLNGEGGEAPLYELYEYVPRDRVDRF